MITKTTNNPDYPAAKIPELPCAPSELKGFKAAGWIVLSLSVPVLTMIMTFGNAPRSFIDYMNMFLAPIVVVALCIAAYAILRYRKACIAWSEQKQSNTPA